MTSGAARPLPEHGDVDAEQLADAAQRVLDLAVHLAGAQVDEPGGEVGEQRLERQARIGIERKLVPSDFTRVLLPNGASSRAGVVRRPVADAAGRPDRLRERAADSDRDITQRTRVISFGPAW